MDASSWSRQDILRWVGDRTVFARGRDARDAELPAWLRDSGAGVPRWSEQVGWVHLNDRPEVVRTWWQAVSEPGRPVPVRSRSSIDGHRWVLSESYYLNLLDHPDVGSVLVVREELGEVEPPDEAPPDDAIAQYEAPIWIIQYLDGLGAILRTDGQVGEVFGRPGEELIGRNVLDVLHPDDHDAAIAMWLEVVSEAGATRTIRQRIMRPDGSFVWIESTVMNQLDQAGAVVAVSHDVSDRKQQEAALRASEQELRLLAESVPVAVFRAGADGTVTFANSLWYELTEPYGPIRSLVQLVDPGERGRLLEPWASLVQGTGSSLELDLPAVDGRTLRLRCRTTRSSIGAGTVVLGTLDDVSEELATTAELRRRAELDPLTGLVNRAGLERVAADLLAAGGHESVLVFVDLDGFKAVNDTWGHLVGDAVLSGVADRLRSAVRPHDVVSRYGGDEFVLLCADIGPGEDHAIVDRLEQALDAPLVVGEVRWRPSASIGVVRPWPGETAASALHRADVEMYDRKRTRAAGSATA